MNGRRPERLPLRISLGGLLLGMLFAGLLAMHGVQASGPTGMSGIPAAGMAAMDAMGAAHGRPDPHVPPPTAPGPQHQHPGGQVCLGLLIVAFVLALLALTTVDHWEPPSPLVWRTQRLLVRCGRPPPSIYQLAVLRL